MELQVMDAIYGMAIGFVIAFLLTVAYHLMTGRILGFALDTVAGTPFAMVAIIVRIIAGPAILAQHALVQMARGHAGWGAIGIPAACLWSLLLGTLLLQLIAEFNVF